MRHPGVRRRLAQPLLPGQAVSLVLVAPFACGALGSRDAPSRATLGSTILAGVLGDAVNLLLLLSTRHGELAIVGVLSSLYPAGTVLIARLRLRFAEVWSTAQKLGMAVAMLAVVLVAS